MAGQHGARRWEDPAIDGLRAFAHGEMRIGGVRALATQAHAAAYAGKAAGLAAPMIRAPSPRRSGGS